MDILNEVYFGKGPIIPLQRQLSKLRKKLMNKPVTASTNVDTEIIKFNRLAESIFGFKTFALYIYPNHIPNAYAFPIDTYASDEVKEKMYQSLMASPEGFKYNKAFSRVDMIIAIHSGLLDDLSYTDEEIMGAVLHEIGHGFFEAVTDKENNYSIARKITDMLKSIINNAMEKVRSGKQVTQHTIESEFSEINNTIKSIKNKLSKLNIFKESMEDNMRPNRIYYTNEKFADTFAAMYGYGEECHNVDIKIFQNVYKMAYGVKTYPPIIETIKMYKLYIDDLLSYIFSIQDPHPAELARIMTTVNYLKKELSKDSIDPKMKREILSELEKMNSLIDDYINYPKDEDSMRILRLYNIKLYEKFGGDRRERDTDNDALFDAIDKRYYDLRNNRK